MRMAGMVNDVDVCELYESTRTHPGSRWRTTGSCPKGEGGRFVANGKSRSRNSPVIWRRPALAYYMWGSTLSEAVIQGQEGRGRPMT